MIISSLLDALKNYRNKKIDYARIISHASFGFLVFFIGLNDIFSIEKDYNIKLGEIKNFDNYSIKLKNLETKNFSNYKAVIGELEISNIKSNNIRAINSDIKN